MKLRQLALVSHTRMLVHSGKANPVHQDPLGGHSAALVDAATVLDTHPTLAQSWHLLHHTQDPLDTHQSVHDRVFLFQSRLYLDDSVCCIV